jgi:hypothetical protein
MLSPGGGLAHQLPPLFRQAPPPLLASVRLAPESMSAAPHRAPAHRRQVGLGTRRRTHTNSVGGLQATHRLQAEPKDEETATLAADHELGRTYLTELVPKLA